MLYVTRPAKINYMSAKKSPIFLSLHCHNLQTSINRERFAGLNFHRFQPIKFSWENFRGALRLQHLSNAII